MRPLPEDPPADGRGWPRTALRATSTLHAARSVVARIYAPRNAVPFLPGPREEFIYIAPRITVLPD